MLFDSFVEWSELRNFKLQQNGQTFLTQHTQSGYKDYIGNILSKHRNIWEMRYFKSQLREVFFYYIYKTNSYIEAL